MSRLSRQHADKIVSRNQYRKEDNIQIILKETSSEDVCSVEVVQERVLQYPLVNIIFKLVLSKVGNYLTR
jgi:hypothetical protein